MPFSRFAHPSPSPFKLFGRNPLALSTSDGDCIKDRTGEIGWRMGNALG
jgi:hypothetical protein